MLVTDMVYITSFVKRYQEEDADLWYVCAEGPLWPAQWWGLCA